MDISVQALWIEGSQLFKLLYLIGIDMLGLISRIAEMRAYMMVICPMHGLQQDEHAKICKFMTKKGRDHHALISVRTLLTHHHAA
jgi:hypothetical protein